MRQLLQEQKHLQVTLQPHFLVEGQDRLIGIIKQLQLVIQEQIWKT